MTSRRGPTATTGSPRAKTGVRSGADLQAAGLVLDPGRQAPVVAGDFWPRLFIPEAVAADAG